MEWRKVKNGEKTPWGQCLTRPVLTGRRRSGFWLVPENLCFSGTNQKAERRRPFGTGLARHCPQGLFSSFFTSLRATFFRPFRLSLVPTICSWVSEDGTFLACSQHFRPTSFLVRGVTRVSGYSVINKRLLTYHQVSNQPLVEVMHSQAIVSDNIICFTSSLHARWTEGKKEVRLRVVPFFPCG